MKFKTTPYHYDLIKDTDRLSVFWQAIKENDSNKNLAYDLGCGCGVLSYFLSFYFKEIISLECNPKITQCAKENLAEFNNIEVINTNVLDYNFEKKADLIVCEMLDTALIDEGQVPILNHAKKFLKEDGNIIPHSIINTVELVRFTRHNIHWDDGEYYRSYSNPIVYSQFNFSDDIETNFKTNLNIKANKKGVINGLKITTYTKISKDIIAGPLPMLNPPLMIPLNDKKINANDIINVELKYIMGGGIETIEVK